MKVEKNKNTLIRNLLLDRITNKETQELSQLNMVEKEMKKQWDEPNDNSLDNQIGIDIWQYVKTKCIKKKGFKVHLELWRSVAALALILLSISGYWLFYDATPAGEYIEVLAEHNKTYTLPDSSKVWMRAGSTIRFAKNFSEDRFVWLKGESLFEVRKRKGDKFRVYIDEAYIEVKGTTFLIKQNTTDSEVTLFNGLVDFHVDKTGEMIAMKPSQTVTYSPSKAHVQVKNIDAIDWSQGKFNFEDIQLEQLIRTINQLYSTDIRLEKLNKEVAFTGSIRYNEPLNDVIGKICFALNLRQRETQGIITIHN